MKKSKSYKYGKRDAKQMLKDYSLVFISSICKTMFPRQLNVIKTDNPAFYDYCEGFNDVFEKKVSDKAAKRAKDIKKGKRIPA